MSIGAAAIGMLGGMLGARSQNRNQRRLMDVQYQNQRMLNQHGHDLQMDMWNKTNYGAQVKHMKDAGLNPALMYGSAGQGGTTGSQGGGSATGGNAAQVRMMDMQNMLIGAELRLKNSQAKENEAKANKIAGVDTEEAKQRIENLKESKTYVGLQSEYQKIENANRQDVIDTDLRKIGQDTANLKQQFDLTDEQFEDLVKEQMGKAMESVNNSKLIKEKVRLTKAQEQEVWEKLDIAYNQLDLQGLMTQASLSQADASMIRAKVEEVMRPMELKFEEKKVMVNSMTNIITSIISGISGGAQAFIGKREY